MMALAWWRRPPVVSFGLLGDPLGPTWQSVVSLGGGCGGGDGGVSWKLGPQGCWGRFQDIADKVSVQASSGNKPKAIRTGPLRMVFPTDPIRSRGRALRREGR
jgi:hypothetical protein